MIQIHLMFQNVNSRCSAPARFVANPGLETQFDMINWTAHNGAVKKLRFAEKKFVTKFIHQNLPMGKKMLHKIHPRQSITCRWPRANCTLHLRLICTAAWHG
jgi:hypothetical protein